MSSDLLIKGLVVLIILAAAFSAGWVKGNDHGTQKLVDYIGKQAIATEKLREVRYKIVKETEIKWRTQIKEVFVKGEQIEKEVKSHVTEADDRKCVVNVGFMRSYDSALTNTPATGGASNAERADSGIPLSVVATTDAYNWKICNVWKKRALGWEKFYEDIRAAQ